MGVSLVVTKSIYGRKEAEEGESDATDRHLYRLERGQETRRMKIREYQEWFIYEYRICRIEVRAIWISTELEIVIGKTPTCAMTLAWSLVYITTLQI